MAANRPAERGTDATEAVTNPPRPKRVDRACDYCRQKRLKCTADRHPCMNCELYGAECKHTKVPQQRASRGALGKRKEMEDSVQVQYSPPLAVNNPGGVQPPPPGLDVRSPVDPIPFHQEQPPLENLNIIHDGEQPTRVGSHDLSTYQQDASLSQPFDFYSSTGAFHDAILFAGLHSMGQLGTLSPAVGDGILGEEIPNSAQRNSSVNLDHYSPLAQRSDASSHGGKVSGVSSLKQKDGHETTQGQLLPGLFIRKDAVSSNYIGLNSTGATIAFCIKESLERDPGLSRADSFNYLIEAGSHVDEAGVSRFSEDMMPRLPSRALAALHIESYFQNVHHLYPVVNQQEFENGCEKLYGNEPLEDRSSELSIFFMILALGMTSNLTVSEPVEFPQISRNHFYKQAWPMLIDAIATPRLKATQILLLHVIFQLAHGKGGIAWVLCGLAVRVSQAIGLHRQSPRDLDLTEEQIHLRTHLWWVAYSLDACLSMTQGRPTAVAQSTYDVDLKRIREQNRCSSQPVPSMSEVYVWKILLAKIQNRLCNILQRSELTNDRLDALARIDKALLQWRDELPMECRPENEILVPSHMYLSIGLLHLDYFNMLRAVHWAAMTSNPIGKDATGQHSNPRICASGAICLSAARSLVRTLNDIMDVPGQRNFALQLRIDHYMNALAVLYRNIFRRPKHLSAKADLEHFRAGKIHLKRDLPRTPLTSTLWTLFDGMMRSAEQLLYQHDVLQT